MSSMSIRRPSNLSPDIYRDRKPWKELLECGRLWSESIFHFDELHRYDVIGRSNLTHRDGPLAYPAPSSECDGMRLKIVLDGVPLPPLFTHCELDSGQTPNKKRLLVLDSAQAINKYDARGITVKVHCTGQGATRMTRDAIEKARAVNPNGPQHEVAHCSGVHDDEYARFKQSNVTAEMSPAGFFVHPYTAESEGRMDWNFPKMPKAGAFLTIGSDWGATADPSLFSPVSRIVETVGNGSKERSGGLLCRMLTMHGAQAVGADKEVGSIEVGKKANFIVVNKDLSFWEKSMEPRF